MDKIKAVKDAPEALSNERRNRIFRESFDWSQGSGDFHDDVVKYLFLKHPEWQSAFNNAEEMGNDQKLANMLRGRTQGSRHGDVEKYEVESAQVMTARRFVRFSSVENKNNELEAILGPIVRSILYFDSVYITGRPEKKKARPLRGHGRKFQSFFCDYIILDEQYPGDPVWGEMIQDIKAALPTLISEDDQVKIQKLVSAHNKWCSDGSSLHPINDSRVAQLTTV